jgi:hypothetical protein
MRYLYDIIQFCPSSNHIETIFCDLDAAAYQTHSALARHTAALPHHAFHYLSPEKRYIKLCLGPSNHHPYMTPRALKKVFCSINRTAHGKNLYLELSKPQDFCFEVEILQVLLVLQVTGLIGALHGIVEQTIAEKVLDIHELETVRLCLGSFTNLFHFALDCKQRRYQEHVSLRAIELPQLNDKATRESQHFEDQAIRESEEHVNNAKITTDDEETAVANRGFLSSSEQEYLKAKQNLNCRRSSEPTIARAWDSEE